MFGLPEQGKRTENLAVTASPVGEPAMAVVGQAITVERYADLDAVSGEELAPLFVDEQSVGVHPEIDLRYGRDPGVQYIEDLAHSLGADEQRLTAVQHDLDPWQPVLAGVLGYPGRRRIRGR
jgi:hypothetical protein